MTGRDPLDRRRVLQGTGILAAALLAGCAGGGSSGGDSDGDDGDGSGAPLFDGWLDNVGNYDGVVDRTGRSEVTVTVGAQGNGGKLAFAPPAVRIDPGTSVVWEWTGEGGTHNVVEKDGDYESDLTDESGFAFEHTFESGGTSRYFCQPHRTMGMKGVVVVE